MHDLTFHTFRWKSTAVLYSVHSPGIYPSPECYLAVKKYRQYTFGYNYTPLTNLFLFILYYIIAIVMFFFVLMLLGIAINFGTFSPVSTKVKIFWTLMAITHQEISLSTLSYVAWIALLTLQPRKPKHLSDLHSY